MQTSSTIDDISDTFDNHNNDDRAGGNQYTKIVLMFASCSQNYIVIQKEYRSITNIKAHNDNNDISPAVQLPHFSAVPSS